MQPELDRNLLQRMIELHNQLLTALREGDWGKIAKVDQNIAECLKTLATRETLSDELIAVKKKLQHLHLQALNACKDECEKLRKILMSHVEHREGYSAYQSIDMYQNES